MSPTRTSNSFWRWIWAAVLLLIVVGSLVGSGNPQPPDNLGAADDDTAGVSSMIRSPHSNKIPSREDTTEPASALLQDLVDAAEPHDVISVPPGVYRETVIITKPLTLLAEPGAEIRGSDIWDDGWNQHNDYWISDRRVPEFNNASGFCNEDPLCQRQEQVFLDGDPLTQVQATPEPGEFAVNSQRQIVLADNPDSGTIEVTTREYWILSGSDDITIQGFTMAHAGNRSQTGALGTAGYSNWEIRENTLSHAHGAVVSIAGGEDIRLVDNHLSYGGQLVVHGSGAQDVLVQGNRISHGNVAGFGARWEAGGLKMTEMTRLTVDDNHVFENAGPGLWCDIDCSETTFSNNRIHHNTNQGISYELSQDGEVYGNVVYENGHGFSSWGWGAGILIQNSRDTEVFDNVVAWNADGISVISQDRGGHWNEVVNNLVRDNVIVTGGRSDATVMALAWLEDWDGQLADETSNNRGSNNRYYHLNPTQGGSPYGYVDQWFSHANLDGFNETPGEQNGRQLDSQEASRVLVGVGVPDAPESDR